MHTHFSQESLKERYHLEDLGVDGRILIDHKNKIRRFGLDSSGSEKE
jgi:hypothetical protein